MCAETVDKAFWVDRWAKGDIGFHRDTPHPSLSAQWSSLNLKRNATVFVPLCGKSHDMIWLAEKGHFVIGVELAQKAIEDFFEHLQVEPTITKIQQFTVFESGPYRLFCGDIFSSKPQHMVSVDAVYDRASLVALPPGLQAKYAQHLADILQPNTKVLIVSLDYDPVEMEGPPFSTPPDSVARNFETHFDIEQRSREHALEANSPLRKRGLTALNETCYVLQRKATT